MKQIESMQRFDLGWVYPAGEKWKTTVEANYDANGKLNSIAIVQKNESKDVTSILTLDQLRQLIRGCRDLLGAHEADL